MEVTLTIVPVPGANPAVSYWTFQTVSVPLDVQPKSAELEVTLVAVRSDGVVHDGHADTPKTSFNSPVPESKTPEPERIPLAL